MTQENRFGKNGLTRLKKLDLKKKLIGFMSEILIKKAKIK
jgi:hypothetical protein